MKHFTTYQALILFFDRLLDKNNDFEGDSSNGDETEDDDFESEEGEEVDNIEGMEEGRLFILYIPADSLWYVFNS